IEISRGDEVLSIELQPRPVNMLMLYGVRSALILLFVSLVVLIVRTTNRDPVGFPIMLCLCFSVFWLYADELYLVTFLSPYLIPFSWVGIHLNTFIEAVSLQLILSTLLHITLVFPKPLPIVERFPWAIWLLYIFPLIFLGGFMLAHERELALAMKSIYVPKLWMNSGFLVLVTLSIAISYRHHQSPLQREQLRWVAASVVLFALVHLVGWNIPRLIGFQPLVPAYDWVLIVGALIPVSMFLAISRHRLFGVRGMVRRRILLLERQLDHEKNMVFSRDERIHDLMNDINQLKSEVTAFSTTEMLSNEGTQGGSPIGKLETRYPKLEHIRKERLIGASPVWEKVFKEVVIAAQGMSPVLIIGETGAGKMDLAWSIHHLGPRSDQVYKEISCAQFQHADPAIALSRIFGIGSGHGLANISNQGQTGLLEECDGGSLFLDDFDRLPLNVQDLLLYPLEGKAFEPGIGKGPQLSVSVKFILATNRVPENLVAEGLLRADILSRLGARVYLPPLRERREDIPLLVNHFVQLGSVDIEHNVSLVSPKALNLLVAYSYATGNVRELKSEIRNAVGRAALEDDSVLRAGYLSENLRNPDLRTFAGFENTEGIEQHPVQPGNQTGSQSQGPQVPGNRIDPMELIVLRKHDFKMRPSEDELGFSHKSRTLSNHLRGLCFKAVDDHSGDIDMAARYLAGADDPALNEKLRGKIRRYLQRAEKLVEMKRDRILHNNLPVAYRDSLHNIIERIRSNSSVDTKQ
ncbi:sigma 54-interacting transcriptional regulator, partial [Gammaproteobacteria bacterium]|nr:sigma 54-interacting transcriptional regulator [Gammaproteobacteria bacterium]